MADQKKKTQRDSKNVNTREKLSTPGRTPGQAEGTTEDVNEALRKQERERGGGKRK